MKIKIIILYFDLVYFFAKSMARLDEIKLPPHNIETEKAVLSCVLIDNEAMYNIESYWINSKDFYSKEHEIIFEAMHSLFFARKTIDVVTLSEYLTKNKEIWNIWWVEYLYDVSLYIQSASWVSDYAKIVKEKSVLRQILKISQGIIWEVYEQKPVVDILEVIEKKIMSLTQYQMHDSMLHIKDILSWRYEDYYEMSENPDIITEKVSLTSYWKLDQISWWFKPWELIILAARPAMGKTSFALNIAENASTKYNKAVAIFSLEMSSEQIADRMISTVSNIPMRQIAKWDLQNDDFWKIWNAMERLWRANIYIDDKGWSTVQEIKSKIRKIKIEKWGIDLIVIDYLQLMTWTNRFAWNRVQEISEISRWLKEMARELSVPVIALSQLSRAVESRPDKRPQLSDLRDSWAIEQDADMVLMLYREEYYDEETEKRHIADIFVRKNRNGPTWEIPLYFQNSIMKFSNLSQEQLEQIED